MFHNIMSHLKLQCYGISWIKTWLTDWTQHVARYFLIVNPQTQYVSSGVPQQTVNDLMFLLYMTSQEITTAVC